LFNQATTAPHYGGGPVAVIDGIVMSQITVTRRSVVPALRSRSRLNRLPADLETSLLTDIELTRLMGCVLCEAARRLGVEFDWLHGDLRDLCRMLVTAAEGNSKLHPIEYRIASCVCRLDQFEPFTIPRDIARCSGMMSPK
jgi:hypothetical protein